MLRLVGVVIGHGILLKLQDYFLGSQMTTLLHTSVMSRRKKDYRILGPLLSMLTFILVLLESFVTRGGIWSSVHSFIVEDNGGTWSRLNYVLENDISVKGFFIMMILSLVITIMIVIYKYRKRNAKRTHLINWNGTSFSIMYNSALHKSIWIK